jgi:hypothetical protein
VLAYIRAVPQFEVEEQEFSFGALTLRRFTAAEASAFSQFLQRRDVFARHAKDRDYYARRSLEFADEVVLVAGSGQCHRDIDSLGKEVDAAEALLVLSTTFALSRKELHRFTTSHAFRRSVIDLYYNGYTGKPRTQKQPGQPSRPLPITERVARRYGRLGFGAVQARATDGDLVGTRLRLACRWLLSSRLDPDVGSAFIKTGTAAESLIADGSKYDVTEKLSDRVARLVGGTPTQIAEIKETLKSLYDVRCDFAHGRHSGPATEEHAKQIELFDRLVTLALSTFSTHCASCSAPGEVGSWFKNTAFPLSVPYSSAFLQRALALA